jgi:CubicO group peptidase (beta-lactamase class C family)
MIGAKTMNRSWCGRPLAICAVGIAVAVVTLAASVSAADFSASDALMLRLMSTHNVSGSALALIKDGSIVLEKGYGFRDLARARRSPPQRSSTSARSRNHSPRSASLSWSISIRSIWTLRSSDTSLICG